MNKLTIHNNYGIAPNELLNNCKVSFRAKGIFTYLQAKPQGWKFSTKRIAIEGKEGIAAVRSGLQELEEAGYLIRIPNRGKDGKMIGYEYNLYASPAESPSSEKPTTVKPTTENRQPFSNKDNSNKYIEKKNNFLFSEKLSKMDQDKDKRMNIISTYWKRKNIKFDTEEKYRVALKRELIPAGNLKPYTLEEIERTMEHIEDLEYLSRWTLETVFKYIDDLESVENGGFVIPKYKT
jgi:hypothetical protein